MKLSHPYVHSMALVGLATGDSEVQRVALDELVELRASGVEYEAVDTTIDGLRAALQET